MERAAEPPSTPPRIDSLERVRETRARTLELVAGLTQEQMDGAPGEGRWSAGEVLEHLVLTDRVYVRDVGELLAMAAAGQGTRLRRTFADLNPSILFLPRSLLPVFELPLTVMSRLLPVGLRDSLASSRWLPAHHPDQTSPRPGRPAGELRRDLAA
ncbi:MAG TPA: DinB family protein, partial [Thermoanaerobaculia bacterium]|nr:DinB family protein [Thermoanaerobaculia bacterium]